MMKMRVSAEAAVAATRERVTRAAARDRMRHRGMGEPPSFDKPKRLRMINHAEGRTLSGQKAAFSRLLTRCPVLSHGDSHERSPRQLLHLPRAYELAIRWLRPSFL